MIPVFSLRKIIIMAAFICGIIFIFLCANTEIQSYENWKVDFHLTWDVTCIILTHIPRHPKKIPIEVKNLVCSVNLVDKRTNIMNNEQESMIYFVTPTYPRPEQVPELIRLGHTLMHVPRIHWIVADDQPLCSKTVANVLMQTGLPYTHISSPKPYLYNTPHFPRGVANRRAALSWIRKHVTQGVLYFGDDDNTFHLHLFDEIRRTTKVSMFPVGLIGGYGVSSPVVKEGKVAGFFDSWPASRTFAVDMAGFAVNIQFIKPSANMPFVEGYEEDLFLVSLDLKLDDIEPLANNCSNILVWHTKTAKFKKPSLKINLEKLNNLTEYRGFANLLKELASMGLADFSSNAGTYPMVMRNHKSFDPLAGL